MNAVLIAGMAINLSGEINPLIQTVIGYRGLPEVPVAFSCPGVNLIKRDQLNEFFSNEEQKAFRVARFSTDNDDDALDIIQDAMLKFVSNYADKVQSNWKPLFYKIVYSKLTDYHRKKNFRSGIMRLFGTKPEEGYDEIDTIASPDAVPDDMIHFDDSFERLQKALEVLPMRQQQTVLLRSWHGFDTQETADIMRLSTGSIKTHYSRGLAKLRELLGDDWP